MDPAQQSLLQYGVLGLAVLVFASVIRYLYNKNELVRDKAEEARKAADSERAGWNLEREKIRAEASAQVSLAAADFAKQLAAEHAQCRAREDSMRKEYIDVVQALAEEQRGSQDALVKVLEKLGDRLSAVPGSPGPTIPRTRTGG